jgi:hypothetical protein
MAQLGADAMISEGFAPRQGAGGDMKKLFSTLKQRALTNISGHMIRFAARFAPQLLADYITNQAAGLSLSITMAILDQERISHCYRCPQRFGLRKVGKNQYACLNHSQEVKAQLA